MKSVHWATPAGVLALRSPDGAELRDASARLADFYNEPSNAALLGNTVRFFPGDVVRHWNEGAAAGTHAFLLLCDEALVGDADLRGFRDGAAEVAILVGPRDLQGKGLGGRFLRMLLAIGFAHLGVQRLYASVRPENVASLRLFEGAGFARDAGVEAATYTDESDDVCLRLDRGAFLASFAGTLREVVIV